ncbi:MULTISPECIES: CDP-alcohol phosphatidyltransferase family protein [Pseudofrankia]|uniref:CDP-alcohol phosphatidyltransferase family protein n=1 Tax=Pseudofrankia TaxID=2994363 RepID=UPI000234D851|nr:MULTISPECIES: CDP-alcohol phosphatidyltransferase family protein [Pseudofrankia]
MSVDTSAEPHRAAGAPPARPERLTYRQALARLRLAQKTVKGAPAYSRFVNRRIGRLLAAGAYVVGLTPNQVTAISAVFTFGGISLLALVRPTVPIGVVICLALVLGYAFDAADGQLARLRGGGSLAGEWLDHIVDAAKISSLHLAVAVSCYRFSDLGRGSYLLVPLGYAVINAVAFFGMILNDLLRQRQAARAGLPVSNQPVAVHAPVWRSLAVVPSDYGLLCLLFALLGVGGTFGGVFAVGYGVLAAANLLFLLAALVRWYGTMTALAPSAAPARPGNGSSG